MPAQQRSIKSGKPGWKKGGKISYIGSFQTHQGVKKPRLKIGGQAT